MKYLKFLYLLRGLSYFGAYYFTRGLLAGDSNSVLYTEELMSSGSQDNIALILVGLISIITGGTLFLTNKSKIQIVLVLMGTLLQFGAYVLIQVGSVIDTMIYGHNIYLIIGAISHWVIWIIIYLKYLPK